MKRNRISTLLLAALLLWMMTGCGTAPSVTTTLPTTVPLTIPEDKPEIQGQVVWCTGDKPYDEAIGYQGDWSLQVASEAQWEALAAEYGLTRGEGTVDFSQYVILVLFYDDYPEATYELTELALLDGMATIGIHRKETGAAQGQKLMGCLVQVQEAPLEINSYRDEESVG